MMIDTPRLTLRQFQLKDLSSLHYYRNHPVCKKFQNWEDTTLEELDVFIKSNMQRSVRDQQMQIALALKETNELVGDIFLAKKGKTITLGFTTSPHFQRQGYMFEALSHFIPYLQDLFPISNVLQERLPIQVETTLLPFKGKIIYDSFFSSFPIEFGQGIREAFQEMYDEAFKHGIITRLE